MKTASGATVTFSHFEVGEQDESTEMFPIYFVGTNGLRYILQPYGTRNAVYLETPNGPLDSDAEPTADYNDAIEIPWTNEDAWDAFEAAIPNAVLLAYLQKEFGPMPGEGYFFGYWLLGNAGAPTFQINSRESLMSMTACEHHEAGTFFNAFSFGLFDNDGNPIVTGLDANGTQIQYVDCNGKLVNDGDAASAIVSDYPKPYVLPQNMQSATVAQLMTLNYAMLSGIDVTGIQNIPARSGIPML